MSGSTMRALLLPVLLFLLSTGCGPHRVSATSGSADPTAPRGPRRAVSLGDTRIATDDDPLLGTTSYDARDLFQYGLDQLDAGETTLARVAFARVIAEFPADPLSAPARYNQALAAERQGKPVDAAGFYGEYARVTDSTDPAEAARIRLHQGRLYFLAGEPASAWRPLQTAQASGHLDLTDTWEARIFSARISGQSGQWRIAEGELGSVRRELRRATRTTGERFPWHSGMVWFHAAELYRDRAEAQELLDVDDLSAARRWLDQTAMWFLESRRCYKRVLEHRLVDWSGPAALELGKINEDFRATMLGADTPTALDATATAVYSELLEEQTRSFLEKAVADYRWLLRDAGELRIEGAWLEDLRGALHRVEAQLGRAGSATVSR